MGPIHEITSHTKISFRNSRKVQEKPKKDEQVRPKPPLPKIQPLFPERFNQCRRGKEDKEILKTFRNVEINIPLLDAIKQIPWYAKFLKELYTNKRKLTGNERVNVGENVSTGLQRKMSAKCKDKGVIIQLADKSVVLPEGVLEDVLVKVNELIFPADFVVIKMEEDNTSGSSDLLLGRPFLSTVSTKIDVRSGTLTMEFDGKIIKFNVYDAISHPSEILSDLLGGRHETEARGAKTAIFKYDRGFYRRFIKNFSKVAEPLCQLLQKDKKFEFDPKCKEAFDTLKQKLVSAPIVQPPDWKYPFEIMCDASERSVGAVLGQRIDKEPNVICYASKTLDAAQTLRYLISKKEAKLRLIRWILLLQEFDIEIRDKRGCENLVADHLSRIKVPFDDIPIKEEFPEESLFSTKTRLP
ncbi:uncharacterized protein LOC105800995 [Gossypium raimondii]|uniref:uncharacterized protein LOC105800995 n=1 Tax=Gossypium raimondii TaxID=29730 RepID=UPI00227A30DC|nr:uncharacterized protein LOC105800995 [Gossypium raimondii]